MKSPTAPRILTTVAVAAMVVSAVVFVVMLSLNAFVLDDYAEYGEVPIPGSASVELPAGDVTVTFHTVLIGGGGGGGLPVPPLSYRITGPGGADELLSQDPGGTTTVNNDARARIGYLHLPAAGRYDVELDGKVSAFSNPKLAFGTGSPFSSVPWICAVVFGVALLGLIVAGSWRRALGAWRPRNRRSRRRIGSRARCRRSSRSRRARSTRPTRASAYRPWKRLPVFETRVR